MEKLKGHDADDRAKASRYLLGGGLVGVPTETVYGLAADARNEKAVRNIFAVKGRPLLDPLIVHCDSLETVSVYCKVTERVRKLAADFWPGPLTLVLPRRNDSRIPAVVSAGLPTLAVRIPAHPVFLDLLSNLRILIAAPSANPFGYVSPTRASHVVESLGDRIDAVLDGGPCEHGLESTILSVGEEGSFKLLRAGPIPVKDLETSVGVPITEAIGNRENPEAPGLMPSHYRPSKGIELFPEGSAPERLSDDTACVTLARPVPAPPQPNSFWLSENGDPEEIARNLFDLLRKLDTDSRYRTIRVEFPSSSEGILRAVRDRLSRAAISPET